MEAISCWCAYVDSLAWEPGQLDESSYRAFLRAGSLGVEPQTALDVVAERIISAKGRLRPRKIESQLGHAYGYVQSTKNVSQASHGERFNQKPLWPERDPALIAKIAAVGIGLADLWESSPVRLDEPEPMTEQIIDALLPGNPLLCVGWSRYRFDTRTREHWRGQLSGLQFIVPNPMSARFGYTGRKLSAHTIDNTGPRRFLVVEFDKGQHDEQAAIIIHLMTRGPLVLVTDSGGKSLHAWFYCAGVDNAVLERFMRYAVQLGADLALWKNRSQFVRMPDGKRPEGTRQPVHYFNPEVL